MFSLLSISLFYASMVYIPFVDGIPYLFIVRGLFNRYYGIENQAGAGSTKAANINNIFHNLSSPISPRLFATASTILL